MGDLWLVSDTHFNHANICKFMRDDGVTPLRPWNDVNEMDEYLLYQWNVTVKPQDKVYHLGDLTMHRQLGQIDYILSRLHGKKRLVRGNHDLAPTREYLNYFDEIYGVRVFGGDRGKRRIVLSHIPLDVGSLESGNWLNMHGHLHHRLTGWPSFHINVCVEHTNWKPIAFEDARDLVQV